MTTPYGLTPQGFVAPRARNFLNLIRDTFESLVPDLAPYDWDGDQILGVLTAIVAVRLGDLSEGVLQGLADALDLNNAHGALLDLTAQLFGLNRRPATQGTAQLDVIQLSAPTAFVSAGTRFGQVAGPNDLRVWRAVQDTTLTGAPGESILVRCATAGQLTAGAGAINRLLDPVSGLVSASNSLFAVPGRAVQSDPELRADVLKLLQAPSRGVLGALYAAAVRAVPAGTYVGALENTTNAPVTIGTKLIPSHGSAIVVWPALSAADAQLLREAIFETKPLGGGIGGDQIGQVVGPDGVSRPVGFFVADPVPVTVDVQAMLAPGSSDPATAANIKAAIEAFFGRLDVGERVSRLRLTAAIAAVSNVREVQILELNGAALDVVPVATEVALLAATPNVSFV
jgi:uncharacterized phage protein gp47/JayE